MATREAPGYVATAVGAALRRPCPSWWPPTVCRFIGGVRDCIGVTDGLGRPQGEVFEDDIGKFKRMMEELGVTIVEDKGTLDDVIDTATKYNLLPADAVIAVTCRHYGFTKIATFDEDFRRVPWL